VHVNVVLAKVDADEGKVLHDGFRPQ
jgi:hypothetical protein